MILLTQLAEYFFPKYFFYIKRAFQKFQAKEREAKHPSIGSCDYCGHSTISVKFIAAWPLLLDDDDDGDDDDDDDDYYDDDDHSCNSDDNNDNYADRDNHNTND